MDDTWTIVCHGSAQPSLKKIINKCFQHTCFITDGDVVYEIDDNDYGDILKTKKKKTKKKQKIFFTSFNLGSYSLYSPAHPP